MRGKLIRLRSIVALLAATLVLLVQPLAMAQNNSAAGGQGLEVGPPLLDIEANPGEQKTVEIFVRNITRQPLIVKAEVTDFVAGGEDGQPKLLLDGAEQSPYSIKPWLVDLPSATIAAGERRSFKLTLNLPQSASPGGHYGVIRFTGTPPELEGTGVSLSASVGTLMLIKVAGQVTEQAKFEEITTSQNGKNRSFFEYGPIDINVRLKNTGNVHIQPKGTVRVVNMLGKPVSTFKFNETGGNVLPASIRKFNNTVEKKLLFGRYKVEADVVYGSEQQIITATRTFWVIPYKLIVMAIGLLALLILLIRQYNRFILKRANKVQSDAQAARKKSKK